MLQHAATVTLLIGMLAPVAASADATSDFAKETLAAHNCYRAAHGVPPLEWSEEIAAYAQAWIDAQGYEHSDSYNSPLGPLGENLYMGTAATGQRAAALWYSEIEDPGYVFGAADGTSGAGHFSAMIWKDAKLLGCAISGEVISCNYGSGTREKDCSVPNMGGCYAEQVPPLVDGPAACD
jgi:hypothetical protein